MGFVSPQEWLPGKERGLSVYDPPMLAIGNIPVIYPYIPGQDTVPSQHTHPHTPTLAQTGTLTP